MADKWFFVWREGSRKPTCSASRQNPADGGPDSKAYLPKVITFHEVPPRIAERLEAGNDPTVLDDLRGIFPAPAQS